jgi:NADPH-dependent curcumin reductase CurA
MLRCRNEPEETVATTNRRVLLKSRPQGEPTPTDFDIVDGPMPEPKDGEYLSRIVWMSLDPYMRGRMSEAKGYATNAKLGDVLGGGTVGQVLKSKNPKFKEGDYVTGFIVSDHFAQMDGFWKEVPAAVKAGKIKYREDIVQGIDRAPEAFIGLLKGRNFGKLLVQVSDDPTRK